MKKRLLIGLTSALLAVTLCLGFASCETDDKKLTDQEIAASAIDHVKQQYDDSAKLETPEDYEVESKAPAADGNSYNVTYTVAAQDENVTIGDYVVVGDSTDGKTKISVTRGTVDVNYTLNASVTVNSATASVAIAKKVPALTPVVGGDDDKTPTDEEKAQSILNGLSLTKTSFNTSGEEVTLPTSTEAGVTVVWSVKDGNTEDYVSIENNTLTIEKLPNAGGDVTVTLSVSVKVGEATVSKPVTITLSPAPVVGPTDQDKADEVLESLNINNITKTYSETTSQAVQLPTSTTYEAQVVWTVEGTTNYVSVENNQLTVKELPEKDAATITLKVTVTVGTAHAEDTVNITVNPAPVTGPTDEDMQAALTTELNKVNDIAITEVKNYDLPAPTDGKISFSWAVKSGSAQFPDGITFNTNQINVSNLPEQETTVTLELTATYVGTQKTDTKEVTVTISAAEPAGPDDQEKANDVLQSIKDQFDSITKEYSATTSEPVSLPTSTQDGATVTWTVDSEYASITDGYKLSITKLPTYKEEDATVTLNVTVTVNGKTATDTVTITVHKAQPTDQDKAQDVLDSLDIDGIEKTYNAPAQDVQLPATSDLATQYSANIKWTVEGDSAYISISDNKLTVKQPAYKDGDQTVTIKVTVSVNDATASTTVEITLKEAAPTDEEKAQEALASLNIDAFEPNVFEALDEEGKTALPTTSATVTKYSANVEWKVDGTSDYVQIKNNKIAIVALPKDGDKQVKINVTVTVGEAVVSGSITITVKKEEPVTNYGSEDAPITVSEALAIANAECISDQDFTAKIIYMKGIALSTPEYSGNYYKQFEIGEIGNLTTKILVYTISLDSGVDAIAQNDEIVIYGYIKNHESKIEFASKNSTYVKCHSNTRGQSTITLQAEGATVNGITNNEKATNGTEKSFTVLPQEGKKIASVTAGGKTLAVQNENTYKFTVLGDVTVIVTTADEGEKVSEAVATLSFAKTDITSDKSIQDYTSTWTATRNGVAWTIVNFNNNRKDWTCIKAGRKKETASVATITVTLAQTITSIDVTLDGSSNLTDIKKYVQAFKLQVCDDGKFAGDSLKEYSYTVADIDLAKDCTFTIPKEEQGANKHYRIVVDTKAGSSNNGFFALSKVTCNGYAD